MTLFPLPAKPRAKSPAQPLEVVPRCRVWGPLGEPTRGRGPQQALTLGFNGPWPAPSWLFPHGQKTPGWIRLAGELSRGWSFPEAAKGWGEQTGAERLGMCTAIVRVPVCTPGLCGPGPDTPTGRTGIGSHRQEAEAFAREFLTERQGRWQ